MGKRPLRALPRLVLLVGALMCGGCISTPMRLGVLVSREGALMTSVLRLGPVSLIRTGSIVPGQLPHLSRDTWVVDCGDGDVGIALEMPAGEKIDPKATCNHLLAGVSYATKALGVYPADLALSIHFVRQGHSIHRREHFWALNSKPRASYWIPVLSSERETLANMVSSISHETAHLLARTNGMPARIAMSERIGHLVGACAELEVLGELRRERLGLGLFNENLDLPPHVMRSNRAGVQVSRDLLPFFADASLLSRESQAGQRMSAYCHFELARAIAST